MRNDNYNLKIISGTEEKIAQQVIYSSSELKNLSFCDASDHGEASRHGHEWSWQSQKSNHFLDTKVPWCWENGHKIEI